MKRVRLVSICAFSLNKAAGSQLLPHFGASSLGWCDKLNKWRIHLGSVPFESYGCLPEPGFVWYYASRECLERMRYWHQRVLEVDAYAAFHVTNLDFEVNHIETRRIDDLLLSNLDFVSIRRFRPDLQHELIRRVADLAGDDHRGSKGVRTLSDLARYPDLLGRALASPPFDRVRIVIFPVYALGSSRMCHLAWVRPGARLINIEQNTQLGWYACPQAIKESLADGFTLGNRSCEEDLAQAGEEGVMPRSRPHHLL